MQGVNTGESGAPNGEQGMRTQEIHIVSSNAHRQAYASMQNQRLQKQIRADDFFQYPVSLRKRKDIGAARLNDSPVAFRLRRQPDRHRFGSDAAFVDRQPCRSTVLLFDAIGDVMPFWLFLHSVHRLDLDCCAWHSRGHIPPPCYGATAISCTCSLGNHQCVSC